ncbi:MAG TPA: response regulator transcription factor [Candidatus Acidoferrales bacterium]|nr:response regulator transcription factor [Candidatus Acidoferrales bacterium]
MPKTSVLLVEDHTVVRQGLRRILENDPTIEIVAEVGDGREAIAAAQQLTPDVAIVDISLPALNGVEVTRHLAKVTPATRVLILSMHADEAYVRQSLKAGAKGYLLKDADDQDLLRAVSALSSGGSYFSPLVSKLLLDGFIQEGPSVVDELSVLSDREREVLQLIAEGKSNKEVAQLLNLSVSTVESHRKHIMDKLDLHNTASMVRFAVRKGIIQ